MEDLGRAPALPQGEQRLRSEAEMLRLMPDHAAAVAGRARWRARAAFSLDELRYEYPSEVTGEETAAGRLARLAQQGLHWRYPRGIRPRCRRRWPMSSPSSASWAMSPIS